VLKILINATIDRKKTYTMLSDTVGYGKDEISSSDSGSPGAGFSPIETPIVEKNICKKNIFSV
jgi:hypothetical protein